LEFFARQHQLRELIAYVDIHDSIAFGLFQWVASVSTLPLLAKDDQQLLSWLDRMAGLYGGLGRDPRMKPLFEV